MGDFAKHHPISAFVLALFTLGFVATYWPVFVIAGVIAALGYGLHAFTVGYDRRALAKAQHRHLLAAHAAFEHHLVMAGDPRGTYGQYTPYC